MPPKNMLFVWFDNNLQKIQKSNCTKVVLYNKIGTTLVLVGNGRISQVYSRS